MRIVWIWWGIIFSNLLKQAGRINFKVDVQVAGSGEGYAYAQVQVDTSCELDQEWITNGCEALANNNKCKLKSETIDGVKTYQYYNRTGIRPLASQKQIGNGSCDLQITRPWWNTTREYECQLEDEIDLNIVLARKANIEQTTTSSGYSDLVDGVSHGRSLALPNISPPPSCTNACKTKRPKEKIAVAGTGPVVGAGGVEYETLYRACTGPESNICAKGRDEILVTDCSCLNEFGAASTMMQGLRQAAQDLTCTTGNPSEF